MEMIKEIYSNLDDIGDLILLGFSIIMTIKAMYNKIKSKFNEKITKFINDAEVLEHLSNQEKMQQVVLWIKDLIPRLFIVVFNDETLEQIAENVYQDMKKFMNLRLKNKTGMKTNEVIKTINALVDDPASCVSKPEENNKE